MKKLAEKGRNLLIFASSYIIIENGCSAKAKASTFADQGRLYYGKR